MFVRQTCPLPNSANWSKPMLALLSPLLAPLLLRDLPALAGKDACKLRWDSTRYPLSEICSDPIRSDPFRSDPIRSSRLRSSPIRSNPLRSDPTAREQCAILIRSDRSERAHARCDPVPPTISRILRIRFLLNITHPRHPFPTYFLSLASSCSMKS